MPLAMRKSIFITAALTGSGGTHDRSDNGAGSGGGGGGNGAGVDSALLSGTLTPRSQHATQAGVGHDIHFDTPYVPQLYALFERLDRDGDGRVSAPALVHFLSAEYKHAHERYVDTRTGAISAKLISPGPSMS